MWEYELKRLFIQSEGFKERLNEQKNGDELLREIELEIIKNPECGDVVQGTGGVRKMRVPDSARGKGKRGGIRVLYLDLPDREHTHLIYFYNKNELDDLSSVGKKIIKTIVEAIKRRRK